MAYYQFLERGRPKDYRSEEVETLARAVRARENRLVLGLPGMGVSNLLRFLVTREDLFEREVTFAYLDCDELDDCSDLEAFFDKIAGELYKQGLGNQLETGDWGYERLKKLVLQVEGDPLRRVVIVVDQADEMLAAADRIFYRKLKALTDLNKRVCYIFAVSPSTADRVDPDNLLFAGRRPAVGRLNEQDCRGAIAEEARRLGVEFDTTAQQRLVRLTGGHPGLLRAISSAVVNEKLDLADSETVLVERLLARGDVQDRCQKVWNKLDPAKQTSLQLLISGQLDLVSADTLTWLQDFGLVDDHERAYRLFSPIFQRFVPPQEVSESPLEPITIVGASKNEQGIIVAGKVFKGGQEVHVSRLELRLIACLKGERRIYSKDEIAAYVWWESERQGVSDYAITDLVRRVRERLGDQYIKTYHGRGYEILA